MRRCFYVTNNDDPCAGLDKKLVQKACINKMKDFYRRGVDLEPFFISSAAHPFAVNIFYAEVIGEYDDGYAEDSARPWRLRAMQDQNVSKRNAWDAAAKFEELKQ